MSDQSVQHAAPFREGGERDTLPTIERASLSEHLEAALAAGTPAGSAVAGAESEDDEDQRVTVPNADTVLLRDALLAVGNNHGQ